MQMKIKCIVVEDEPLAMQKLVGFIDKVDDLEVARTFDNAIAALAWLKRERVDLIFLDIQMEEFTGIQFLETLRTRPRVILTTAYDKYAVKGYELEVDDYLLKPFTFQRFLQAVERVAHRLKEAREAPQSLPEPAEFLFVKTEYRLEKVRVADILYVEGMNEYLRIVTPTAKIMTLQRFKTLEEALPAAAFCRVHRSWLVAIDKIDHIERNRIRIGEQLIPIGETYKRSFFKKIGIDK